MQRRRLFLVSAALLALHLVACASEPPIFTAFDPLMAFPATATFVWDEDANSLPANPSVQQSGIGPVIQQVATDAISARGYTPVQSGTPSYRLSYQMEVYTWISQEQSSSTASLALQLADYVTNKTVWLGSMSIVVDLSRTPEERRALLKSTIERVLANFPPSQPRS